MAHNNPFPYDLNLFCETFNHISNCVWLKQTIKPQIYLFAKRIVYLSNLINSFFNKRAEIAGMTILISNSTIVFSILTIFNIPYNLKESLYRGYWLLSDEIFNETILRVPTKNRCVYLFIKDKNIPSYLRKAYYLRFELKVGGQQEIFEPYFDQQYFALANKKHPLRKVGEFIKNSLNKEISNFNKELMKAKF